ncbi:MAG: ATP-binding cassette domain-containing protein [Bacteroidota bacterium]
MISTSNVTLQYGKRILFENVSIKFIPGNCYGLIGANGAGKSTYLKILSGEIEAQKGQVVTVPGARISVLKQNQNAFDDVEVLKAVIMGNKKLYDIVVEKDALYAKEDFTEADGMRTATLESDFAEMNGWNADSEAAELLGGLGIKEELHSKLMQDLNGSEKVRVLLAQALFGNPDVLLLDEPTNNLDVETVLWLENFLADFQNTVIVVSHDRHFLDNVCTHIADIDYNQITLFTGNYSFWYESSQLLAKQKQDGNKKMEDKRKELQDFVARFSANASKSSQATSRKKLLDKLVLEEIKPSTRKYPYINFKFEKESRNVVLDISNIKKKIEGVDCFPNMKFEIESKDKVAFLCKDDSYITMLFEIITENQQPDAGTFKWGGTSTMSYFPKENSHMFNSDLTILDWLANFNPEKEISWVRSFLGRMLFGGDESLKKCKVLSGGEKVRCQLAKIMLEGANTLVLDQPTNHLDLESITALNTALTDYEGNILLISHDHQLIQTIANRIIEITPKGIIDKRMTYDEYILDEKVKALRASYYA